MLELSDATFQSEVLDSKIPVMVDFSATWCGPCQRLKPIVEELAKEYDGKVKIASFDIDSSPGIPSQFNIRSVPTMILFKGGKPVDEILGLAPKPALKARIDKLLS